MAFSGKRTSSEAFEGESFEFWDDIQRMYSVATALDMPMSGWASFHVGLDGRAVPFGNLWFVSGVLLADWAGTPPALPLHSPVKVVVKLSEVMYQTVACNSDTLQILQAAVVEGSEGPIIDTTSGHAVVAGTKPIRKDTTLEVAEIFCGGFNGWSQGIHVLKTFGYSCGVKWLLDTDECCYEGTRQNHPSLRKAFTQTELQDMCADDDPVFLCADLEHVWWAQAPRRS